LRALRFWTRKAVPESTQIAKKKNGKAGRKRRADRNATLGGGALDAPAKGDSKSQSSTLQKTC